MRTELFWASPQPRWLAVVLRLRDAIAVGPCGKDALGGGVVTAGASLADREGFHDSFHDIVGMPATARPHQRTG